MYHCNHSNDTILLHISNQVNNGALVFQQLLSAPLITERLGRSAIQFRTKLNLFKKILELKITFPKHVPNLANS